MGGLIGKLPIQHGTFHMAQIKNLKKLTKNKKCNDRLNVTGAAFSAPHSLAQPYAAAGLHSLTQPYTALHSSLHSTLTQPYTALHSLTQPYTAFTHPLTQPYTGLGLHSLTQPYTALHSPFLTQLQPAAQLDRHSPPALPPGACPAEPPVDL